MKEHTGNIKFLLIIVSALISITNGEVAVLVACLALSACVDEIRIQILFKERRELTNMIKELWLSSDTQMAEIAALQGMSQDVKDEVKTQTTEIGTLRRMSQDVKEAVKTQVDKIEKLSWSGVAGIVFTIIFGILGLLGLLEP